MQGSLPVMPHGVAPGGNGAAQVVIYNIQVPAPRSSGPKVPTPAILIAVAKAFLVVLLWASWTLLIAGVSRAQGLCNSGKLGASAPFYSWYMGGMNQLAVLSGNPTTSDCVAFFGQLWWAVWLQFAATLLLTITALGLAAKLKGLNGFMLTVLYLYLMNTIQLFFVADQYQNINHQLHNLSFNGLAKGEWVDACTVITVGAITCMFFNFVYIIVNTYKDPADSAAQPIALPPMALPVSTTAPPPPGDAHPVKPAPAPAAVEETELASSRPSATKKGKAAEAEAKASSSAAAEASK